MLKSARPKPASRSAMSFIKRAKRWMFVIHRWFGIVTCLFCVMWFLSGLVMLYVPFPSWSSEERLTHLPRIDHTRVRITPDEALAAAAEKPSPVAVRLEMFAGEPVYRMTAGANQLTISASTGKPLGPIDKEQAQAHIEAVFRGAEVLLGEIVERDQWTVTRRFDPHRPLFRFDLDDAEGTSLYVSSRTGEIVQESTRHERLWNWLGAIPHWIYFTPIRQHQELWRQVVMWTSAPVIIGGGLGLWLGILRIRVRRRYSAGRITPYVGWTKWHHLAGLTGGIFLFTWIASGWLSVNPFNLLPRPELSEAQRQAFTGLAHGAGPRIKSQALDMAMEQGAREITTSAAGGIPFLLVRDGKTTRLLDAATGAALTLDEGTLRRAVAAMLPKARLISLTRLESQDLYWLSRHGHKPLPVLRAVFDDPDATWIYVDPKTGEIAGVSNTTARAERWLFRFAHTYDLPVLIENAPARDLLIWALSLAGFVVAISGTTLALRSLKRRRDRSRSGPATTTGQPQSAARAH